MVLLTFRNQSNFHIFYYFYDGLDASGNLDKYKLNPGRRFRYLRIGENTERRRSFKVRNDPSGNARIFREMNEILKVLEMESHCEAIWKILAGILILGEVRFLEESDGSAEIGNIDTAHKGIKFAFNKYNKNIFETKRNNHQCDLYSSC